MVSISWCTRDPHYYICAGACSITITFPQLEGSWDMVITCTIILFIMACANLVSIYNYIPAVFHNCRLW